MKKLFMILLLVLVICFVSGCQQGEEMDEGQVADVEADVEAIRKINEEYDSAHNAGDINRIVALYTDEAVRFPAAGPACIGKNAIRDELQQMFDQVTVELKTVVDDIKVSGDLAFYRGAWEQTNTPKDGGEPLKLSGNAITILQKQADGTWKIICQGWSHEQSTEPWEIE